MSKKVDSTILRIGGKKSVKMFDITDLIYRKTQLQ